MIVEGTEDKETMGNLLFNNNSVFNTRISLPHTTAQDVIVDPHGMKDQ